MTRRISSRIEKLEAVLRPQQQEYKAWELCTWNASGPPVPLMTIYWAPGRPTRTIHHRAGSQEPQ